MTYGLNYVLSKIDFAQYRKPFVSSMKSQSNGPVALRDYRPAVLLSEFVH